MLERCSINMVVRQGLIAVLLTLFGIVNCIYKGSKVNMSCENGVCSRKLDQGPCVMEDDQQRLFRWEPHKVTLSPFNYFVNSSSPNRTILCEYTATQLEGS